MVRIGMVVVYNAGSGWLRPAIVLGKGLHEDEVKLWLVPTDIPGNWPSNEAPAFLYGVRHGRDVGYWRLVDDPMFPVLPGESL